MKRIVWTEPAKADVRRIDREAAMRILNALNRFVHTGEGDIKALQGRDELRLRIADYRLFFVNIAEVSRSAPRPTSPGSLPLNPDRFDVSQMQLLFAPAMCR